MISDYHNTYTLNDEYHQQWQKQRHFAKMFQHLAMTTFLQIILHGILQRKYTRWTVLRMYTPSHQLPNPIVLETAVNDKLQLSRPGVARPCKTSWNGDQVHEASSIILKLFIA